MPLPNIFSPLFTDHMSWGMSVACQRCRGGFLRCLRVTARTMAAIEPSVPEGFKELDAASCIAFVAGDEALRALVAASDSGDDAIAATEVCRQCMRPAVQFGPVCVVVAH